MTVRRMITFPERGNDLLTEAIGGAKEMAAGQYLTAVLAQRRRVWERALDALHQSYSYADIYDRMEEFVRKGSTLEEIMRATGERDGHHFHALAMELEAQNQALIATLQEAP